MNLNKKKLLTLATAGFFAFSTATAFAAENDGLGLEIVTETNGENTISTDQEKVETPTVLPGDFFYFVKTALEKIKLALTFDDNKEAKLLATYATERLVEAEVLFSNGDEDKALETIKNAITYLESAEETVEKDVDKDLTSEINKDVKEETLEDEDELLIKTVSAEKEESVNEVEKLISQNIIALTAALEKVKNPRAKAALQKNIDKSYAKLARKLEKLEEAKVEEKASKIPVEMKEESVEKLEGEKEIGLKPVQPNEEKVVVEEIKKEVKKTVKEVEKEIKEVKKQKKEEKKLEKHQEKQQKKQLKQDAKEAKKKEKQGKNNHKHKGNGKDN